MILEEEIFNALDLWRLLQIRIECSYRTESAPVTHWATWLRGPLLLCGLLDLEGPYYSVGYLTKIAPVTQWAAGLREPCYSVGYLTERAPVTQWANWLRGPLLLSGLLDWEGPCYLVGYLTERAPVTQWATWLRGPLLLSCLLTPFPLPCSAGAFSVAPVSPSNQPRGHGLRQQSLRR